MEEWMKVIQNFGLPVTLLIFMGGCFVYTAKWMAKKIVEPVVDRYIKLIDALIVSVTKQAETAEKIGIAMTNLVEVSKQQVCRANEILGRGDG